MTNPLPRGWPVTLKRLIVLIAAFAIVYMTFIYGFESNVISVSSSRLRGQGRARVLPEEIPGIHAADQPQKPMPLVGRLGTVALDNVSNVLVEEKEGTVDLEVEKREDDEVDELTETDLVHTGDKNDMAVTLDLDQDGQSQHTASITQTELALTVKEESLNLGDVQHASDKDDATDTPSEDGQSSMSRIVTKSLDELRKEARTILEKFALTHNRTILELGTNLLNITTEDDPFVEILKEKEVGTKYNSSEDESVASNITLNSAIKVVLHGRYRSGSTFSSEFFHRHKQTFYMYEPLRMGENIYSSKQYTQQSIRKLFSCNLDPIYNYKGPERTWIFRNVLCALPNQMPGCTKAHTFVPSTISTETCKKSHLHVIKTIRVGYVNDLWYLMRKGVKVVQLFRDPRGTMFSRRALHSGIRKIPELTREVAEFCRRGASEIKFMRARAAEDPDLVKQTYYPVRYEDLATNATKEMYKLYKFIGVAPDESLIAWANLTDFKSGNGRHGSRHGSAYSTDRDNPEYTSRRWRYQLPFEVVKVIDGVCGEYISMLGYRFATTTSVLRKDSVSLLKPFSRDGLLKLHWIV